MKLKKGDMIQFKGWFGDVWAEVDHDSVGNYVTHYMHNKGGTERWCNFEHVDQIRTVIRKKDFKLEEHKNEILHMAHLYQSPSHPSVIWKNLPSTRYSSNHRERHPDCE